MAPPVLATVLLLLTTTVHGMGTDKTTVACAQGEDVVQAVIVKIHTDAMIFPEGSDHRFMSRIACVETMYGDDTDCRSANSGGIWGLNKTKFDMTKNSTLSEYHQNISIMSEILYRGAFEMTWTEVKYEDLNIPILSGLAARLYLAFLEMQHSPIPSSIEVRGQAAYWSTLYTSSAGTEDFFVGKVAEIEEGKELSLNGTVCMHAS